MSKPPSTRAIAAAVELINRNICDGSDAGDDETATVTTGGLIGDVAALFDRLGAKTIDAELTALPGRYRPTRHKPRR